MSEGRTDIKKGIFRRVRVLYALFFFVGMLIAGKILYLQYGPKGPALRNKGTTITYERVKLEADRGDVLACDGRILATSVPMYEVRMDFAANGLIDSVFLRDVDSLAGSLSSFFGDKSKGAYKLMLVNAFRNRKKNRYTLISPRRVNHLEIKQIAKFPLFRLGQNRSGFIARQINKRMLPHGRMAARTIGMVNEAGTRLGIEGAFDSVLRGIDGSVMMQRVSGSFRVPVPDEMNVDPVDGIDVVTTLDVDIQDVAEKALRDQLIAMQADWGTAILMEVATGEIRAMANLTRYSDERVVEDFNYAIGMNLEPGSTEKLASLITLLDDAGASLDETYDTGDGRIVIGRAKVVDSHACGLLTLKGVFEKSSNVGFAMAVNKYYRDDPKRFVDHLCKMGLDQPLGLQIAGEQKPVIRKPGDKWWDGTTLTMMSYGYALRLTPLKTLTFYNAVANGQPAARQGAAAVRTDAADVRCADDGFVDRLARDARGGARGDAGSRRGRNGAPDAEPVLFGRGKDRHGPDRHGTQRLHRPQRRPPLSGHFRGLFPGRRSQVQLLGRRKDVQCAGASPLLLRGYGGRAGVQGDRRPGVCEEHGLAGTRFGNGRQVREEAFRQGRPRRADARSRLPFRYSLRGPSPRKAVEGVGLDRFDRSGLYGVRRVRRKGALRRRHGAQGCDLPARATGNDRFVFRGGDGLEPVRACRLEGPARTNGLADSRRGAAARGGDGSTREEPPDGIEIFEGQCASGGNRPEALFRARVRPSRNLSATEDCRAGRFYERREAESAGGLFGGSAESGWCRRFSARCRSCRRSGRDGKTFCRFGRRCGICWRR